MTGSHAYWPSSCWQALGLALALLFLVAASVLAPAVEAATVCASPGRDTLPASGIVNSYWAGASATNGSGSATITLGAQRTGSANTPFGTSAIPSTGISAGDLLVIMQMQGSNAGAYEYVTVVSPAGPTTSGTITVRGAGSNGGLVNTYTQSYANGKTFQVIRVPQTLNATISGNYSAPPWDIDASGNGTGGVFVLDVAQQATLSGTIDVSGQGFRGGAAFDLTGDDAALTASSVAYSSTATVGASKGEGTSGTPGYVFDGYGYTIKQYGTTGLVSAAYTAAAPSTTAEDGNYSAGSFGFGAIGNAGGGGNDAAPTNGNNQYNSGGAGGGSAGRGGQGGWTWVGTPAYCENVGFNPTSCPFTGTEGITDAGGRGGQAVGGLGAGLVTMGGGGGAGTVNNNVTANSISAYPPIDVAVDPTTLSGGSTTVSSGAAGAISGSGARGGGVVLIRAGTFNAGAGAINANGIRAYNQFGNAGTSEAAGGGGGGGAIVVLAQAASGSLTASAAGGRGGDPDYFSHGPGGGGGGGFVLTNFSVSGTVDKGGDGYTPDIGNPPAQYTFPNHYGSDAVDGVAGYLSTAGGTTPGTSSGAACSPDVAATVTLPTSGAIGATITGTYNFINNGPSTAIGVGYSATLTAGLPATGVGAVALGPVVLNGSTVTGATATYNTSTGAITFSGLPSSIPSGQTLTVGISFVMPANGTSVSGTDSVSESATDPVPSNNSGSATTAGTAVADDATTITGLTASAAPNAQINGVLNFVNNGPSTSNGVSYTATLPPGAAVSTIKYDGTTLTGASATVAGNGTVTFTGLPTTLNPNDTVNVAFNATMPASGANATATSGITATTNDSNTSNNNATAIVTGTGSADLATTITGLPSSAQAAGTAISGTVTFQNNGPNSAQTPTYTVQVPPGSSITAAQVKYNGTAISGVTVTIDQYGNVTFGGTGLPSTLNSGDAVTIGFNSTMPANGSNATATSSISSPTADPNLNNNNASATVTGIAEADLASATTGFATFAQTSGTAESGTITFSNNGPSIGTGVTYTTSISGTPTNVVLGTPQLNGVAISGATATLNAATGVVTYSGLPTTLNSGDKVTVAVSFTMPGDPVTVSTNISGNTTDPVPSNNAASVTINGGNDLAATVNNFATATQAVGANETGTIQFTNVRGSTATGISYAASLSPGLVVTLGTPTLNGTAIAGATATYNTTTGAITFTGLPTTLALNGVISTSVAFTMPASNVNIMASISESPNDDTYLGNNSASTTVSTSSAIAKSDMTVSISGLGGTAAAGSTVSSGVIDYTNNSATVAATSTMFISTLPVGATITSITLNGVAIAGASGTVSANGTVTYTGMPTTVAANGVVAVAFSFPMPSNGSAATATASVTSTNDSNANNNSATATELGDAPTDLQTTITQPASAAPSATISGTLNYLNNGPVTATTVSYQMTLPVSGGTPTITSVMLNGSLLSVTTSISSTGVVTFTGMPTSLNPGDDVAVAFTAKMPASGASITTTGQISYPGTDTVASNNAASATTISNPNMPVVAVTKTVDQTTHNTGDTVNWTLKVANTGNTATTGVITLTDTLPSNISNVTVTPTGATCSPTQVSAGTTLTCSVPAGLAATNGVATVLIQATLASAGTYSNSVTPSGNANDNPTCAQNACSTITVVGSATMQVFKSSVHGVGSFGYALTNLSNTTDHITTTSPSTSTGGVINAVTTITTPITINENSSPTGFTLTSASCVDTNSATTGNTGTFGTLSGTTLTVATANIKTDSVLQCTFVNTVTDALTIAKSGPTSMTVGTPANFTITVTNSSATVPATAGFVQDVLPAGFTFDSASGEYWTCTNAGQTVSCTFSGGTIAPKGTSTITVTATPTAVSAGVINYASIDPTGGTNAPTPGTACTPAADCAASTSAPVVAAGLSITKSAPSPGLMPGAASAYTLTVTNNGSAAATTATVSDQLPSQLTYVSSTGSATGWSCTNASGLLTCTYAGSIAAGSSSALVINVKANADAVVGSQVTNYASINSSGGTATPTPGASCTPASSCAANTASVAGPNVAVTKSVDQANHSLGDTITWTLKATNSGASATAGVVTLTDTLPSTGIVGPVTVTPSAPTTCTTTTPAVGSTFSCSVPAGLAANGGIASVVITATASATGTVTNTVATSGPDNPTCATGACSASTTVSGQSLTLQKVLNTNRISSTDQFTVQIKNGSAVFASATTTGSGSSVASGSTGETPVAAGTAYTLTEVAAGSTTLAQYSSTLACTNANTLSTTVLPTAVGGTVTPAVGDRITCTITNSAEPVVTLTKALASARVHSADQFTVQILNGSTTVASATSTGSGSTLANNTTGATSLVAGTSYTLGEVAAGGTNLAQYSASLACSNSNSGSSTTLPTSAGGTLTPTFGDNITCTLTNTPKPPVVTLLANLTGNRSANTDQFTLQVNNGASNVATTTTTGSGATLSNNSTGATTLVSGTTYTLAELAAGTTNLSAYTSTLSCSNTDAASSTTLPTTLPGSLMPTVGDNITCTISIAPKAPVLTLTKALGSARLVNTDQFTVDIDQSPANTVLATATTTGSGSTLASNTTGATTVVNGTTYTFTEVASGTTLLNQYTQALACTNSNTSSTTSLPTTVGGSVTPVDGDNISCTLTNTAIPQADVATSLSFPSTVNAGQAVSGTVSFTNNGPSPAAGVTYSTTLSAGLGTVTFTNLPSGVTASYNNTSGVVTYTGLPSALASGATEGPITIGYTQPASGNSTVAATIASTTTDPNSANNSANASIGGVPEADVATTLSFPGTVNAGQSVSGTVTFSNNGPSPAAGVTYATTLLSGLGTVTFSNLPTGVTAAYNNTTGAVTYSGLPTTLASGVSEGPLTITYTQPASGTSSVTSNIATSTADPNSANNSATATINGVPEADVATTLSFPATENAGQTVSGTVTFSNNGPSSAAGVTYGTTLSTGLGLVSFTNLPTGVTASYNNLNGVVTYTGLPTTLAAGASEGPITISYVQPIGGTSSVSSTISTTTADPNSANNSASVTINGVPEADLATALAFPTVENAGNTVTGTVSFTNNGPSPATGVTYSTTLNAALGTVTFSNLPTGVTASYNNTTGVVTYTGLPTTLNALTTEGPLTISYTQPPGGSSSVTSSIAASTADPVAANNSATVTIGGVPEADVATALSFPATVNAGQAVSGTVTFSNNGPSPAAGVTYTTTLTAGLGTVTFSNLPSGVTAAYNNTTGAVTYSGLPTTLASGASEGPITIAYTQPAGGTSGVTSSIATTTADPNTANNSATATINGVAEADLATTLAFPGTVNAGNAVTGTLTFTNNGPSSASGVTYTTTLSVGLGSVTFSNLPTGVTASYNNTTGAVTYTGLPTTLAAGVSEGPITISYTQPAGGTSSVNATIAATTADPVAINNSASVTIGGVPEADVATALSFPATENAGQAVSGTLTFTNNGPSPAAGVTYSTTLTAGLGSVTFSNLPTGVTASYNNTTGAVTYTGLPTTLASGATEGPITIAYTQPAGGTSGVTATIGTTTADPNLANNSATDTINGVAEADLATALAFPTVANAGNTVTGTVTFANNGPSSASGVAYTTTLSAGLGTVTFSTLPSGVTASYNNSTGAVTYAGLPTTLAAGASEGPITISYTQPGSASSTVTAGISSTTADPLALNNNATVTITGVAEADVAVAEVFPLTENAGQAVSGTVTFANNGPSPASAVTYTTTLTAGLGTVTFSNLPTGVTATYNNSTGAVTYTGLPTTLAAGASEGPITIAYTQAAAGTSSVTSSIASSTADPNTTNNSVTVVIGGVPQADVATTLNFPSTVNALLPVSGTVTFSNLGPSSAANVTYSTTLTAGLGTVTFSNLPTGVTATYNNLTGAVTYTGLPTTLAAGASEGPITIAYTQPEGATSGVGATIGTSTADPNLTNNAANVTITGSNQADVATNLSFVTTVNAGQVVTGTVSFVNNGPATAAGVTYATTLTAGLGTVTFSNLPSGVTAAYNNTTGAVTYTGLPTTLASGVTEGPITITYTQPGTATSTVSSAITTTSPDPNTANNNATVTISGAQEADASTSLNFPASENAGQTVTGTVTFANAGPSTAAGVTYTTTLTAGLGTVTFSTLPTGVSATYNNSTGVVTYTGLPTSLAAGASEGPITLSYTQPGTGTSTITSSIATTTADPVAGNNSASATVGGNPRADAATSVSFPTTENAGQAVSGTVSFTNNGPSTADAVTYATQLTAGLGTVTFSNLPNGASASYNNANGVVTYAGLPTSLAAGTTEGPITIAYTQPATGTSSVSATITTTSVDPNSANNTASATISGVPEADVATTLAFPGTENAGQAVSGTLTFSNNGPSSAAGVTYSTTLSAGLGTVTFSNLPTGVSASYNNTTGAVTYTGLPTTLASGASEGPITIAYTQPTGGTSAVTSSITTTTADPNSANNSATANITGVPEADVATALNFPATVNAGQAVSGTVTFSNNGPSPAAGVTYTTTLSAGLGTVTFSTLPTGVSATYNNSNGVVTYTGLPTSLASGTTEGPITIAYTQLSSGVSTVSSGINSSTADPNSANNAASTTINGQQEADVATALAFPASVNAGQTVTGTVTFSNNGPSQAAAVTYTTTLSAGLGTVTFSNLPTGVTASYNNSTGAVTYSGLQTTLASGASEGPITISYTQPAAGTSSVASSIASSTADPNTANNSASTTVSGAQEADVAVSLNFPANENAGQPVSGTVSFTNNGPSPAAGVTYSTTLSAGLGTVTFSGLPTGVSASYNNTTGAVTYTGLPTTLASGASEGPITIAYTQPGTATSSVGASIATTTADPNSANNTASATVTGTREADVATSLNFPAAVNAGQPVSGSVTFTNNGPSPAAGVTYSTTLSPGLGSVTFSGLPTGVSASYNNATGVVTYTGLPTTLASGASEGPITIAYTQPATGVSSVNATVNSTTADPNTANNSATSTVTGVPEADVATSLSFPATVNAGQTVTGTVTFSNNGPSVATGVTYSTTLSAGLGTVTFSTLPTGVTATYNNTTGAVTYSGLPTTLAAGASAGPITLTYSQAASGVSSVTSTVASATADPNATNNTATATINGVPQADVATTLNFPASVNAGQPVSGTVSFTNNGPSLAVGVTYSTTLSAGLGTVTFSNLPTGVSASYNNSTGVVTYTGLPTNLASGATEGPITIAYTQPASGTSSITAGMNSATADPNTANNTATSTVAGSPEADVATSLNFPASVNAGQPVSGSVSFTNSGPSTAAGVTYGTTLSAGLGTVTFSGLPTGVSASYNNASGAVTYTGLPTSLASGASEGPITIAYTQPGSATSSVAATIASSTADPNSNNNSATVTVAGNAEANLATTLNFPASVNAGQPVSGTVSFANSGPSTAAGVTYSTTLTAGLGSVTFSNLPTGVSASYNNATGVVTYTGLPTSLASGASEGPITIAYTQPASGTSTITSALNSTTPDPSAGNNSATATVAGNTEADVATSLNFPASVNAGQPVSGSVSFTNNGPSTAAGVTYSTTLSAGLGNVTFSNLPNGVTASYNNSTGAVTYTGLPTSLASGASEGPITIAYTQPASAASTVAASIATTTADPNTTNNSANATVAGSTEADLATTLNFPNTVNAGQAVSGTLSFVNNGPSSTAGVTYSASLSSGLGTVTFSNLPNGVTATYNNATGAVTFTGLPTTLASGASEGPITIAYTQPASGSSSVSSSITGSSADPNSANNSATVSVGGTAEADVATSLSFPTSVNAGQVVSGTVSFSNLGPSVASGTTYTTTLSPGLGTVTFSGLPTGVTASYNNATGAVTYTGLPSTLPSGSTEGPITIAYTQPASGTSSVSSSIASATPDPNTANGSANVTVAGVPEADLATTLNFPGAPAAGQTASGTVTFTNNGPSSAVGVSYGTTLTAGLGTVTFSNLPNGATATYNNASGVVTYSGLPSTLASGSTEGPITIAYTQPPSGTSSVASGITSSTADPDLANNNASTTVPGTPQADVSTFLTFPASVNAGQPVSGTVAFYNNGPSTALATVYSTTLSAGLGSVTFTGLPNGVTATYNNSTGAVTYTGLPTTLAAGSTEGPITIAYTQPASGTSSVASSISSSTSDPLTSNNSAQATVAGSAEADVSATLVFPASENAGQAVVGTVKFANAGPSVANNVTYSTTLSAGLGTVTISGLPTGVTASYNNTTGVVTYTGLPSTLASGASEGPITLSYTQPPSGSSSVAATIGSSTNDPNSANNSASVTIAGALEADSATSLNFPANVNAGQPVSGTVSFTNNGPSSASGLTYGTTLSSELGNVTFSNLPTGVSATYNATTGVVTYTGLPTTLAAGSSAGPITIAYTQPASGSSTVSSSIASSTADPNTANNSASAAVGGAAEADLSASFAFPNAVAGTQPVSGTLSFSNAGPSIANGVSYTLSMTPGLGSVTFSNLPAAATATYNNSSGVVTFTGLPATLGVAQSVGPITIAYTQPPSGTSALNGSIASTTADPNTANNSAQASITGTPSATDVAIQLSAPATVAPDGALNYTLTITNNGPAAANNASFSDTLPAALGTPTASCATLSGGATCGAITINGHAVSGSVATLPVGASVVVTISTTAPAQGSVTNTATVAPPTGLTDPVASNNTSSATTTVGAIAQVVDVSVTQSGTTSVQVNGAVTYDVDVTNGGPAAANNAVFTYNAAAVVSNVTWTCQVVGGGALCPAASGSGQINQTIATFPVGGHLLYVIHGTAPAAPQQYVNTASVAAPSGLTDSNPSNNSATVTTNVEAAATAQADLAVTLNGPDTVAAGQPVSYSAVVFNNGPAAANGATFTDQVPTVLTNVTTTCVASGGAVCPSVGNGNNLTPVIATLPSGGALTFTITGTAPSSGTFSNSASISPPVGTNDPVPSNNSAGPIVTTVPVLNADLSIQKNAPAQVLANGTLNYTIVVNNAGPNAANGATIVDQLPAGYSNVTATCADATGGAVCGAVTITGSTLNAVAASLPAAGAVTISISGRAPASGTLTNSASVAPPSGVSDPNASNNSAGPVQTTVVASVPAVADLSTVLTGPSVVTPGGLVTYRITVTNAGPASANGAVLSDVLPASLTHVQASCGDAVGGALCGPVNLAGNSLASTIASLPAGASVTFTVTASAPASGSFSNSATVGAAPGTTDPNLANNTGGPLATAVGNPSGIANLGISKTGPDQAGAGASFSYSVVVSNAGPAAADGALISDQVPAGLSNISATCASPTNGAVCGPVRVSGSQVSSQVTHLPALGTVTLTITVTAPVPSGLAPTTVVNRATVTPPPSVTDPDTTDNVSGAVQTAIVSSGVSGTVWLDLNHDRRLDPGDPLLPNWIVELFRNGLLVASTTTNASGQYSFAGLPPGAGYSIDFRDPGSKAIYGTPTNGQEGTPNPESNAVIGNGIIESLTLKPGINIAQQSLPVDPSGVVYDSVARTPVGGATVTLVGPSGFNPATELVGGAANATQVVDGSGPNAGGYQFLLIDPGQPGGAPAGTYMLVVTAPSGYLPPPAKGGGVSAPGGTFVVPGPSSASTAIQPQVGPPKVGTTGAATRYYFDLTFNPGSGAIINNQIPLDRIAAGALTVQKSGNTATADIGETVLYTVVVTSTVGLLPNVTLTDNLPRGFNYIPGTATVNGAKAPDPKGSASGALSFALGNIGTTQTVTVTYRVRVGVGAQAGDGINRAQASSSQGASSNIATFKVDVSGGVFTTDACVIGKVFVDCNGNQIQDQGELGIPGVRLYFSDGTFVISDSEGKYSYCGLRPTTHTLKVDKTTLPAGAILVESSNRNALDPGSLFIDLKNGELHQADFIEGSCSPQVMDAVKARRSQGEVNAAKPGSPAPALIFDSKPPSAPARTDAGDHASGVTP